MVLEVPISARELIRAFLRAIDRIVFFSLSAAGELTFEP